MLFFMTIEKKIDPYTTDGTKRVGIKTDPFLRFTMK